MAVTWANVFAVIGKAIKAENYYASVFATALSNRDAIFDELSDKDIDYIGEGLSSRVRSDMSALSSGVGAYQNIISQVLFDRSLVLSELPLSRVDLPTILSEMFRDMTAQTTRVQRGLTSVTVATVTKFNATAGDLAKSLLLDGRKAPMQGAPIIPYYVDNATKSELGIVGTVYFDCIDATTAGAEVFRAYGTVGNPPFNQDPEAIGESIQIVTSDSRTLVTDGGLETYASSAFTNWTVTSTSGGTAPTISQETSTVYRGSSAMKISGSSYTGTVKLTQNVSNKLLTRTVYLLTVRMKVSATGSAAPTVNAYVKDAAGTTQSVSLSGATAASTASTAWQLVQCSFAVKHTADPADLILNVEVVYGSGVSVDWFVDDLCLTDVDYINGAGFVVVNGQTPFRLGDRFSAAFTRNGGVIQEAWRKQFLAQLPSVASSPEIAESLAT